MEKTIVQKQYFEFELVNNEVRTSKIAGREVRTSNSVKSV